MAGTFRVQSHRSTRLAELQTAYPVQHWVVLVLLGASTFVSFLIESDQAAIQFLDSLQLRLLFTIMTGVGSAGAALCVDLNDPFRGNFRVTPSADQLYVIRATLAQELEVSTRSMYADGDCQSDPAGPRGDAAPGWRRARRLPATAQAGVSTGAMP